MAPVSPVVPQASVTPGRCHQARRAAYEYWKKPSIGSDPLMRQVFSNKRGINPLQRIARIFAVWGIAGLAVWTLAAVLSPESRGYDDPPRAGYNQTEVDKPAEAHPRFVPSFSRGSRYFTRIPRVAESLGH